MDFESAHRLFLDQHLNGRTGERRDRLQRGHREAEQLFCRNVWWPLRHNFDCLHPEYEVTDWRGLRYFCDFAWITPHVMLVIEIKGFGPHVQDMDRRKFCREMNRETFLTAMGFQVISFAYDDVAQHPELCVTLLRMVLGRYAALDPARSSSPKATIAEREIIRLACTLGRAIRPIDVVRHLGLDRRTATDLLQNLCKKQAFEEQTGASGKRIVKYAMKNASSAYL
ncbi:DUF559 domain-containing protein [Saccharibacillus alkalitolerans]|uniref:DUF559 domain-containing protein n=1 Tax=Saccharibacillus alkalitolerans TaxID=2705290 RepID=A0ABX0FEC9_9BACL|nr:DUF559 domain-containing protein [Saccharibacillus alkalitolerans]NGZ77742.1 DUF559 domain-containing protein [Saccharibacillus alkalitolerans]